MLDIIASHLNLSPRILTDHGSRLGRRLFQLFQIDFLLLSQQRLFQPLIVVQLPIECLADSALEFVPTLVGAFISSRLLPHGRCPSW